LRHHGVRIRENLRDQGEFRITGDLAQGLQVAANLACSSGVSWLPSSAVMLPALQGNPMRCAWIRNGPILMANLTEGPGWLARAGLRVTGYQGR